MSSLVEALKRKYQTPEAVLTALGLDSALLSPAHKEIPMSITKAKITPSAASIATLRKLAADAKLEDVHGFLDSLDKDEPAKDEETPEEKEKREAAEREAAKMEAAKDEETPEEKEKREAAEKEAARLEAAKDAEPLKAFLKDKISEDDMKALDALMNGEQPTPVKDAEPEKEKSVTQDELSKAVKDAVKVATDSATKTQKAIREAENFVRPWVGNIAMAHDSAEAVFRTALGALGVKDVGKLHPEALKHVLAVQPVPGSKKDIASAPAMDAAMTDSFNKRFPGAARIGQA